MTYLDLAFDPILVILVGLGFACLAIGIWTPVQTKREIACQRLAEDMARRVAMMAIKPPRGPDGRFIMKERM